MTERLAALLHAEADEITVPRPPTADLLTSGRRMRRRRAATGVVGACVAVTMVAGGAVAVSNRLDPDVRVIDPEIAAAAYAADGAFAVGRDLYVGEEHFRWDESIKAIYYTAAGVVVRSGDTADTDSEGPSNYESSRPRVSARRSKCGWEIGSPGSSRTARISPTPARPTTRRGGRSRCTTWSPTASSPG